MYEKKKTRNSTFKEKTTDFCLKNWFQVILNTRINLKQYFLKFISHERKTKNVCNFYAYLVCYLHVIFYEYFIIYKYT